jgi:hypothetical protein
VGQANDVPAFLEFQPLQVGTVAGEQGQAPICQVAAAAQRRPQHPGSSAAPAPCGPDQAAQNAADSAVHVHLAVRQPGAEAD